MINVNNNNDNKNDNDKKIMIKIIIKILFIVLFLFLMLFYFIAGKCCACGLDGILLLCVRQTGEYVSPKNSTLKFSWILWKLLHRNHGNTVTPLMERINISGYLLKILLGSR